MTAPKANKGISRIDSGSTHGYFVRAYHDGKTYSKLFSDRKYGGKDQALEHAIDYRDELNAELEAAPQAIRKRRIVTADSRNKTGELGVSRTTKIGPNGTKHECYSVSWRPEPNVQKCTSFSIKKYGEEEAFKMAVAHRRKMVADTTTKNVTPLKTKQPVCLLSLKKLLLNSPLPSGKSHYECIHIDELCTIFDRTEKTGKVMIPTDLILEWITALEAGIISPDETARIMRDKIKINSQWANYLHGFETHLSAIVKAWASKE